MQHERRRARFRRSLWAILSATAAGSFAVAVGLIGSADPTIEVASAQADDQGEHDHSDHDHASSLGHDGRFTGPGEVWPPRPKDATDVVALDFEAAEAATDERAMASDAAAELLVADGGSELDIALVDADVQDALGAEHVLISVTDREIVPGSDKDAADAEATLVLFYSHDRAATVEVYVNGDTVLDVISRPAAEEQPPLTLEEKHRATELARTHWEAAGDDRIDLLEGFVILGVEPGGAYYDSRVAYVSFHLDNTARPELITWVDLTDETILDAEVDR